MKKILRFVALFCTVILLCPAMTALAKTELDDLLTKGTVTCEKLKLRSIPSDEARTLGTYAKGTQVVVLRNDGTWCEVLLDGQYGYMMSKYLKIDTPYTAQGYIYTQNDGKVYNLFEEADVNSAIAAKYLGGAAFEIVEQAGDWYLVRSGRTIGYLPSANTVMADSDLKVFTYIGENDPFTLQKMPSSFRQEIGSMKGMAGSKGSFSYQVNYPVLALGVADADISSFVRNWIDMAQEDHTSHHRDTQASLIIDYSAEKLDKNYATVTVYGTYTVDGLEPVIFAHPLMIDLNTGDTVNGKTLFKSTDRILFQLETCFDEIFGHYVEEYCTGIHEALLERAVLSRDGVELYFQAGEILPIHLGAQHITLPYYRTAEFISLDTPVVSNNTRNIDPSKPMIALTFDDGPSEETLRIVETLEKYDSKGTFCVVGSRLEMYESVLRATVASGQEIACHTWNHKNLTEISSDRARSQITQVNDLVYEMTGYKIRVLRPPYGDNDKKVRSICADLDMYIAHWKLDTQDWVSRNSSKVYKKIVREVENGAIILCHDLYSTTADAVIQAIPELISDGYQLVTVTEMLSFHKDGIIPGTTYSRIDPANIDTTK